MVVVESKNAKKAVSGATVGFEEKLWAAADRMRGHMVPAAYKHAALGLIFLNGLVNGRSTC